MTVIAWDGKTLAADKQVTYGVTKQVVTKIFRHGEMLLAICGNASAGMELIEWFKSGAVPRDYPEGNRKEDSGASLIVISVDRIVRKYECGPFPSVLEGPFCAFGSGDESALVAMACGLDARAAVEVTCRFNTGCGMGIDTLELQ